MTASVSVRNGARHQESTDDGSEEIHMMEGVGTDIGAGTEAGAGVVTGVYD